MRDGKGGASRRPVTSHVGKKRMVCHVRVHMLVDVESAEPRSGASEERRDGGEGEGWSEEVRGGRGKEFMTAKNLGLLLTCWMIRA